MVAVHGGLQTWSLSILSVIVAVCLILTFVVWRQPQNKARLVFKVDFFHSVHPPINTLTGNKKGHTDYTTPGSGPERGTAGWDCVVCVCGCGGETTRCVHRKRNTQISRNRKMVARKWPLLIFCWVGIDKYVCVCVCAFSVMLRACLFGKLSPHRFHYCRLCQLLVCSSTSI